MFGTSMQSLLCGISSTALSVALLPVVCWHISGIALQSFGHGLCFSRAGCAPWSLPAKELPRHLRPKIRVKSLCYLLFSVVFAADWILIYFSLWEYCILTP